MTKLSEHTTDQSEGGFIPRCIHNPRYDPLFCISFRINNLLTWNGFIFQSLETGSTFQYKHPHIFVSTYEQGSFDGFKRVASIFIHCIDSKGVYKGFHKGVHLKRLFLILKLPSPKQ